MFTMHTEAPLAEKMYRLPRFVHIYLLLFPLIGILLTGFGLLTFLPSLNRNFLDSVGTTSVGIVSFGLMMALYKAIKATRLVLTENGITYYGWGYRIYTPWQNVTQLTRRQLYYTFPSNLRKFRVLQLRQPSVLGIKLIVGKQKGVAVLETDWWNPARAMKEFADIVPLTPMLHGRNWKERALTRDIQEHAPWILIDDGVQ
jgi:hypothetical protein